MNMTTLKLGVMCAIVIGGVVTPLAIQHQSLVKQREENRTLRQQVEQMANLEADNDRLSNLVVRAHSAASDDQLRELLKLRGEVGMLRSQSNQVERLRTENRRLQASLAKTETNSEPQEVEPGSAERETAIAKINDAKLRVASASMRGP
jgi:hypothetical protein